MKTTLLKEYDVVSLTESIGTSLPQGTLGVILMVLDKNHEYYEVEFVNEKHEPIEVTTVNRHQLKFVERP